MLRRVPVGLRAGWLCVVGQACCRAVHRPPLYWLGSLLALCRRRPHWSRRYRMLHAISACCRLPSCRRCRCFLKLILGCPAVGPRLRVCRQRHARRNGLRRRLLGFQLMVTSMIRSSGEAVSNYGCGVLRVLLWPLRRAGAQRLKALIMATSGVTLARRGATKRRAARLNAKSTWTQSRYRVQVANDQFQAAARYEVPPLAASGGWVSSRGRG